MTISGNSIIAGRETVGTNGSTHAVNPATGEQLEPQFSFIGSAEVNVAAKAARDAFDSYRSTTPEQRAAFLERIADLMDADGEEIIGRAMSETGLPQGRLTGELGRTTGQLRMFARELRLGAFEGVRVDEANAPHPDLRQRQIPLGPVLVFGASNFPLAFSTAGGDTASALAAGCPVIVKAHNSHAGTAELAGRAITQAVTESGLPAGVFSIVFGPGASIGQELAKHPAIAAIAFTGSRGAGTALMATAAARPVPVPVYAEMSSINPVVVLPGALAGDTAALSQEFVGSLTLGSGQFCTNPGLVFVPVGNEEFENQIAEAVRAARGQTMLSASICAAYLGGVAHLTAEGVELVASGEQGEGQNAPSPAIFRTHSEHFRATPELQEEVFGAAALIVRYRDAADLLETLEALQGQLTATIRMSDTDLDAARAVLPVLERTAGRILVNGWPTGVEVNDSIVHGGPYPATSDSRTTSVGTFAITRFLRPVAYQNFPEGLLPEPVGFSNPWALPRRVNGQLENK